MRLPRRDGRLGTIHDQVQWMWKMYHTSGSEPESDLDRIERVVSCRWTKDLASDRNSPLRRSSRSISLNLGIGRQAQSHSVRVTFLGDGPSLDAIVVRNRGTKVEDGRSLL